MKKDKKQELFAIVFKESMEILTPDSFKQYWPNYGSNNLYGWRPAKKVYYKLGHAKRGFSFIPDDLKPKLAIAKVTNFELIEDGESLQIQQKINKEKKEQERKIAYEEWQMKKALQDFESSKAKLEEYLKLKSRI